MQETIEKVLNVFENFRMAPVPGIDKYHVTGRQMLADKISPFIERGEEILFVMLGYPFKSLNKRDKVIGDTPDLGELLSISNFGTFNNQVKKVYPAGIRMQIVSDGYVFNDVLGVPPSIVQQYEERCRDYARKNPIDWYNMTDFYSHLSIQQAKDKLRTQFPVSEIELSEKILYNVDTNTLYRGMIIFMEEELAINTYASRNQLQKAAKKVAREAMLMNETYSLLVDNEFSSSIRLSMHTTSNEKKFSFQLVPSIYAHHSPWHSVIAISDNTIFTMHKKDAELQGYEIVKENNQPFYYAK